MSERLYYLAFSAMPGIGPIKFKLLLERFGSAKAAWKVTKSDLVKSGLGDKLVTRFEKFRQEFSVEGYAKKLKEKDVRFLILTDDEYPSLLKQTSRPPFVLFVKGDVEILRGVYAEGSRSAQNDISRTIAVVGTRKVTNYGREVTEFLVRDLVSSGFTIVSGLALGIDAVAHKTALENSGKTIAVLGCGVDCCTPRENQGLYNSIVERGGVILSEFPLSQIPTKGSFPSRNRIIAGLSLGVLVTEGAEDSGSLITADYAFKFARKVFAVPGPITSNLSKGPYKLIAKGAKLVINAQDIIQELGIKNYELGIKGSKGDKRAKGDTSEEMKILEILENEPLHFDEIVRRSGLHSSQAGSLLSIMEIKGMVRNLDSGMFGIQS